jgi:ParB family chromosome partitioning protein
VRQAEQIAARAQRGPKLQPVRARDRDIAALEEELSERLGTRVTIVPGKKSKKDTGRIVIDYSDLDHLDQLLTKLRA